MSVRSAPSRLLYTLRDDVNRPQRLPSVGERIKAEGVFGAGAAGDGVVCEFRHGVCGGEFILENANVDLPDTAAQDSASKSNSPAVSG